MKKIPRGFLYGLYISIAIIALKICGNVEEGNFRSVFMVIPAFLGLCIGTYHLRKQLNQREIAEIIHCAYERARTQHITYATEDDIIRECLTKKEAQRLRVLRGQYPYEAN